MKGDSDGHCNTRGGSEERSNSDEQCRDVEEANERELS